MTSEERWSRRNQRLLTVDLDRLHERLNGDKTMQVQPEADTRLAQVHAAFRLSDFERDLLLWCAGVELDSRFSPPTLGAALSALDNGHWDALAPAAPLRHWRLIEVGAGQGFVHCPLRIDERILHHLTGVTCLDSRLEGVVRAKPDAAGLVTQAQAEVAAELAVALSSGRGSRVTVQLDGAGERTQERVADHTAAALGRLLLVIPGERIPPPGTDNAALARLAEREVALLGALPFVPAAETSSGIAAFIDELGCPAIVAAPGFRADIQRTIPEPTVGDQRELWRQLLGQTPEAAEVATAFKFEVADIEAVARDLGEEGLHHACRLRARTGLSGLADHIEPYAGWDELVLPDPVMESLRDIARQVRHRSQVYDEWGMAGSCNRGLGITALFTGESGTGKTLAAEILAAELDLDLYRIDLAAVVSKYIGETEKNLKRVFDAADASGAVLLFDEADAIFGKRSEVRDSHDRYANLEISYLLQRMETYRGLAVLTTNLRSAVDRAFLRRIRFVVTFPFPDPAARARIWQLMFPPKVPVSGLEWRRLAQLQLAGGHIRTVALSAAFLAAAAGEPVTMAHVLAAARREYAKLEKPLTDSEIGGWL